MSDFQTPAKRAFARKNHICDACGYRVERAEPHITYSGRFDGVMFRTHLHPECWDEVLSSDENEFGPGDFDPPTRVLKQHEQRQEQQDEQGVSRGQQPQTGRYRLAGWTA